MAGLAQSIHDDNDEYKADIEAYWVRVVKLSNTEINIGNFCVRLLIIFRETWHQHRWGYWKA